MKKTSLVIFTLIGIVSLSVLKAQITVQKTNNAKPNPPGVGLEVGNIAPEINLQTPDGKSLSLASLRGNIVLVDFWASWCRPCRMENPNVVMAYQKYKNAQYQNAKGFTVYSVSLDREKNGWVQAIAEDKLEWKNHVSDLKFWYSEAAQTYGVQAIPTNWLLNEKGEIVARNLRGAALDQELDKLVKK